MKNYEILDCTLRDGSYVLNFNFSLTDTFFISKALFESGINRVEVGHGLGLGASSKKNLKSLHNDNEYIQTASSAKISKKNKIGCFCFVENAKYKNYLDAKKNGLDFIRFAYEENNINKLKNDINFCKKIGIETHLNLIKTYKYTKKQLLKIIEKVNKLDIDYLYLVDSSGGMVSDEIENYFGIVNKKLNKNIALGFHGHNNLGMANSNCITALKYGAKIIDTSLLGMGRGAGNASTEALIAYLDRNKRTKKYNLNLVLKFIQNYLTYIFKKKTNTDEVLIGKSYFHDSEIDKLKKISKKNNLNYKTLLNKLSFKKGINEKIISKEKKELKKKIFKMPKINITDNNLNFSNLTLDEFKKNLNTIQKKTNSQKIITICRSKKNVFKIYNENDFIFGHIESKNTLYDEKFVKKFKNYKIFFDEKILKKKYYTYSESELKEKACLDIFNIKKFKFIKFIGGKYSKIKKKIIERGKVDKSLKRGIYIIFNNEIKKVKKNAFFLLLNKKINKKYLNQKLTIIKPNYALVLSHHLQRTLEYENNLTNISKRIKITKNFHVVEKGVVGRSGDIIVDNIKIPSQIIGQSNGLGEINKNFYLDPKNKKLLLQWMYNSYYK